MGLTSKSYIKGAVSNAQYGLEMGIDSVDGALNARISLANAILFAPHLFSEPVAKSTVKTLKKISKYVEENRDLPDTNDL